MTTIMMMMIVACGTNTNFDTQVCKLELVNCRESLSGKQDPLEDDSQLFLNRCVLPKLKKDAKQS